MTVEPPTLYCANHPQVATTLRCNRCEKPICSKCAVRTPTGYRCRECMRGQQKVFETAIWFDYPVAIAIAAILAFLGGRIAAALGFFTFFVAPIAGVIIAEVVRVAVRKRRSKNLFLMTTAAAALGSLLPIIFYLVIFLFALLQGRTGSLGFLYTLIWQGVYVFLMTSTVYYRLGGIHIG